MIQLLYICYLMPPSNHRVWPTISSALLLNFANPMAQKWNAIILDVEFEPQVF